jgi:16S rRNA processing protein RimM
MSSKSSRTTEEQPRADLPERVAVGRVVRPHGVRGEVVVTNLSDVPDRLAAGRTVLVSREAGDGGALTSLASRSRVIASSRPQKSGMLVRFEGVEDRDQAEELRGAWLEVDRSQVPEAPEGTYYWYQLLGCRCRDRGDDLGEVVDLLEDGGGLLLIVSDGERRLPIPFVAGFLRGVDVERGTIDLELPPGLIEACASRS